MARKERYLIGLDVGTSDTLLAKSALVAVPAVALVAWVYGRWSTRRAMVLFGLIASGALLGFAILGNGAVHHQFVLTILVILLLGALGGVISMLTPYASEVYPTRVRAGGTAQSAASCGVAARCR